MQIGLSIIIASMVLVTYEGLVSYYIYRNFFPSQVLVRWGQPGIAFFAHGGMWGDLVFLPPVMAWVITQYSHTWSGSQIAIMGLIGFAITLGNHLLLVFTQEIPDPIGWQKEKWNTLIGLHFVYMSTYVALAGLFFCYSRPSLEATVAIGAILGVHMAFGMHIPLGIANLWFQWDWCPDFLTRKTLWAQAVVWATLAGFSWFAAGWRAGLAVTAIAINLAIAAWCVSMMLCTTPRVPKY